MINIKKAVQAPVTFKYFRDGSLWYSTVDGDIFPVPANDAASATFNQVERGIRHVRWMRKWNANQGET